VNCINVKHIVVCFNTFFVCNFKTLLILTKRKREDPKREGNMTPEVLGHMITVCGLVVVDG
jgi:hypothetical protein